MRAHPRACDPLAALAAAVLASAELAGATPTTLTFTYGPIRIASYSIAQSYAPTQAPNVGGYIVGMRADVVDEEGQIVSDDRVMLHHVVFAKLGVPDYTRPGLGQPLGIQRFYRSGEERNTVSLPPGYGYPNAASDRWGIAFKERGARILSWVVLLDAHSSGIHTALTDSVLIAPRMERDARARLDLGCLPPFRCLRRREGGEGSRALR